MIHSTKHYDGTRDVEVRPYQRLAADILTTAINEFFLAKDLETSLDCLYFLAGSDAKFYVDSLGVFYDPLKPICDGRLEHERRKKEHEKQEKKDKKKYKKLTRS